MARKTRVFYPGALYHVMLRGNHGEKIFFSNDDRHYFYKLIDEGINRFDYHVHAFCLMINHVHLAIQVSNTSLSKIIQNLAFRYSRWVNKKQRRVGHLFQGRHKAILVDIDAYLLNLVRYIHLNPIRANIVEKLEQYPWSSHLSYLNNNQFPWLNTDRVLSFFSSNRKKAQYNYLKFMMDKHDLTENKLLLSGNTNKHDILGDNAFIKKVLTNSPEDKIKITLPDLVNIVCEYYSLTEGQLHTSSRNRYYSRLRTFIAILAKEFKVTTTTTVASYFKRDASGLLRAMQRLYLNNNINLELNYLKQAVLNKSLSHT